MTNETAREKFERYHENNPDIWRLFEKFSLVAASRRSHFSARAIFHRIRWDTMINSNDDYKVNNNYSPFYVEMFEEKHPQHKGFFRRRGGGPFLGVG